MAFLLSSSACYGKGADTGASDLSNGIRGATTSQLIPPGAMTNDQDSLTFYGAVIFRSHLLNPLRCRIDRTASPIDITGHVGVQEDAV